MVIRTVTMTRGLPASGKSTWAREQLAARPGQIKRINKDDLRSMLDDNRHSKNNEKLIEKSRDALILAAVSNGFDVIVDDTNLASRHEAHIRELVKGIAAVKIQDFTNADVEVCIARDLTRDRSVGSRVIRQMYNRHIAIHRPTPAFDESLRSCIVVDLDGTLAIIGDRSPYDAANCERDLVNEPVRDLVGRYAHVVLCSGRQDKDREPTARWLATNNIRYDELWMRETTDQRQDSAVKEDLYRDHILGRWNVLFVVDDRQQVVDTWRRLGLTCLQVAPGDF
jgi:predicted kinase